MTNPFTPQGLRRALRSSTLRRTVRALWGASIGLVIALSLLPDTTPPGPAGSDKLWHALAYLALGVGAGFAPAAPARGPATAAMIVLGWAIEGVQALLPWRSAEVADGLVNTVAALIGAALALAATRYAERPPPPNAPRDRDAAIRRRS